MGAFEYVAMDQSGKQAKGLLEGDTPQTRSPDTARSQPVSGQCYRGCKKGSTAADAAFRFARACRPRELALITRQLASLSQSGLPLEEALLAVAQQNDQPRTKSILLGVRAKVMEGHSLADGFGEFPQAFPELYRATVAAGEQSGHLDVVLERLADYTEARQELRQRITNALVYPIALVVMAVGIISFMLATVVPKIVGVFENTSAELPALTTGLIATSDFLRGYWPLVIAGAAAVGWLGWWILQKEGPRRQLPYPAVAPADRWAADTWREHGPVYAHAEHPCRQWRADSRSAEDFRRGYREPADARCGD